MSSAINISIDVPVGLVPFWNVNAVVEVFVLSLGIYMILTKSTKQMHEYKWYLLNIAISIFNFDVSMGVLLRPISLFPLYGAFDIGLLNWFILTFNYGDNREVIEALYRPALALILGILNNTTLSLVNGFLYRWIALRPGLWLHNEKRYMYMVCAAFQLIGACPEPLILLFCYTPMEVMQDYIRKKYPQWTYIFQVKTWMIFDPEMCSNCRYLLFSMAFFLVAYVGIAVWALLGIFSALKSNIESFSAQTIKLHRQLTLALMVQASVPFAMFIFPMGAALVMLFTGLQNVPAFYTFLLITVCSHSNFNVVLMLTLTSCYRETLRDAFYHLAEKVTGGKFKITKVKEISVQPSGSEY